MGHPHDSLSHADSVFNSSMAQRPDDWPNDNLMPLLMQPLLFAWLFLVIYFIQRFFISRQRLPRVLRLGIAFGITLAAQLLLNWLFTWETLLDLSGNPFYFLGLILLNVLFSIWYKRK